MSLSSDITTHLIYQITTSKSESYQRFDIAESIYSGLLSTLPLIRSKADKVLESISRRCFDAAQVSIGNVNLILRAVGVNVVPLLNAHIHLSLSLS